VPEASTSASMRSFRSAIFRSSARTSRRISAANRRRTRAEEPCALMPRRMRAARGAESLPATPPGTRSRRSPCRRLNARVRSATKSSRLSEKAGAALRNWRRGRPLPALLVAPGSQCGGQGIETIILAGVATREHSHPRRKLGWHVHHRLAGRCQPLGQVPTPRPPAFSTAQRRSGNRFAQRSRVLKPERFCRKLAHSMSSPTSSTAATTTLSPYGDRPRSRPSSCAHTPPFRSALCHFGVREGHSDFGPCSHTSFESLPHAADASGTQA
jgi:hypothetical protein